VSETTLYPLRFEPIFQYRLWGGRRLSNLLSAPLPDGSVGEAWILSDRDDHPSHVANGPLKGHTLGEVMEQSQEQLMGRLALRFRRFPLLLKFLDVREMLSVQVHPSDKHPELIPPGESSKTEAWVVLEAQKGSRIYAGLQPGTTQTDLRSALTGGVIAERLLAIDPKQGDAIFIPAGTVHTLGDDVVVFEIQQNSDLTFRLYDWGHIDSKTGQPRPLQVDKAFASIDFEAGTGGLMTPIVEATTPVLRERLFDCGYFNLWRLHGVAPFNVGATGVPRVLVCIQGSGHVEHNNIPYAIGRGDVCLLPAEIGVCSFRPTDEITMLEIAIPE
jgi:mannose-6-phosphate isomerase